MTTAVQIVHIVVCLILMVVILLQSGKSYGLTGAIAGGAETFFGKNKGKTLDAKLSKWTSVVAILFIITSLALFILMQG